VGVGVEVRVGCGVEVGVGLEVGCGVGVGVGLISLIIVKERLLTRLRMS